MTVAMAAMDQTRFEIITSPWHSQIYAHRDEIRVDVYDVHHLQRYVLRQYLHVAMHLYCHRPCQYLDWALRCS